MNLTRGKTRPKTTERRLTSLRSYGRWAGIKAPLEDYIAPKAGKSVPHPIPEGMDGIEAMIEKAKGPDQVALVGLCGFTGARIGETLSVITSNVDISEMLLEIRGKGDKTRIVPINTLAWNAISEAYIDARLKNQDKIVPLNDRWARKIITNLGERAGLSRHVSSHDLRATFATHVYDLTLDLRLVQELLGHSSSTQTEVYTGVRMAKMRDAVNW